MIDPDFRHPIRRALNRPCKANILALYPPLVLKGAAARLTKVKSLLTIGQPCTANTIAKKLKAKPGRVKYVGIVSDAAALGVSREHLYRVLSGKRQSRLLSVRYHDLKMTTDIAVQRRSAQSKIENRNSKIP